MIKKIEHFWKGLSNDKTQISCLPPEQYGDRFFNFVEGITLSSEEAHRDARRRDEEAMHAANRQTSMEQAHGGSSHRKSSNSGIPPMPTHLPPAPPAAPRSPEAKETIDMAQKEARRTEMEGASEKVVPDRTLKTIVPHSERDSMAHEPVLPIVEEQGESNSRDDSDMRPATPAKDTAPAPSRAPPPTPPKTGSHLKPDSADSGYAGGSKLRTKVSRESLNKNLPPLPT